MRPLLPNQPKVMKRNRIKEDHVFAQCACTVHRSRDGSQGQGVRMRPPWEWDWTGLEPGAGVWTGPGGWSLEDDVCRVSMMRETERRTPTHKQRNALTTHTHSHSHRSHFTLHSRSQSDENEIEKNGRSRLRL